MTEQTIRSTLTDAERARIGPDHAAYIDHLAQLEAAEDCLVRLRGYVDLADEYFWREGLHEAIDEIVRLRAEIAELRKLT